MAEFLDFYEPAEDSFLLQEQVKKHAYGKVVDVGTGSGIQALTAATVNNVTSILAIDINPLALTHVQTQAKTKHLRIKTLLSSKFTSLPTKEKFDTIICNPPYLPEDAHIVDPALFGGKHGFEWSEDFLSHAANYLDPNGQILFLFSSLTIKEKIDGIIAQNLLESVLLSTGKIPFETLYIYKITKSPIRKQIESAGISSIQYHAKGKRGLVYKAKYNPTKLIKKTSSKHIAVAIKITNPNSHAKSRIEIEGNILKEMNKHSIGPKLYLATKEFLVLEFIEGVLLEKHLPTLSSSDAKVLLTKVLAQCFTMDALGYSKEEMHHPYKHILLSKNQEPIFIDFERATKTDRPKNVSQCLEYFARNKTILTILNQTPESIRTLAKTYQKTKETYNSVLTQLFPPHQPTSKSHIKQIHKPSKK